MCAKRQRKWCERHVVRRSIGCASLIFSWNIYAVKWLRSAYCELNFICFKLNTERDGRCSWIGGDRRQANSAQAECDGFEAILCKIFSFHLFDGLSWSAAPWMLRRQQSTAFLVRMLLKSLRCIRTTGNGVEAGKCARRSTEIVIWNVFGPRSVWVCLQFLSMLYELLCLYSKFHNSSVCSSGERSLIGAFIKHKQTNCNETWV